MECGSHNVIDLVIRILTNKVSCPKCDVKIDSKTELDKNVQKSVQDNVMDAVLEVDYQNWELEVLKSDMLVLVEFWHIGCLSCKDFNPIYIQVAKENKDHRKFVKLNVLENKNNRGIAIEYGLTSTPTLVFFCDGMSIAIKVERDGFETKERLEQLIRGMKIKCFEQRK